MPTRASCLGMPPQKSSLHTTMHLDVCIEGHSTELQTHCPSFAISAKTSSHPLAKTSSQPLAVLASDSAQAMQKRWEYVGHKSWVLGENIPALLKGGAQGGHSLNAAGLQCFGKCVMNVGKVSSGCTWSSAVAAQSQLSTLSH